MDFQEIAGLKSRKEITTSVSEFSTKKVVSQPKIKSAGLDPSYPLAPFSRPSTQKVISPHLELVVWGT